MARGNSINPIQMIIIFFVFIGVAYVLHLAIIKRQRFPALFMSVWFLSVILAYATAFSSPAIVFWWIWTIAGIGYCGWKGFIVTLRWTRKLANLAWSESEK